MSTNTKILQIFFKPEQMAQVDGAFTPYDNTATPRPELREWYIWDKEYDKLSAEGLDYWGFVSWKFKEKTNLRGQDVLNYINANPGYDVYLFNPCIVNEAVFINSWEQGDNYHPNISAIGNSFLHKLGYADYDVREVLLDRNRTVFANYVVGNSKFWDKFMAFSRQLFTEADKDAEFKHQVFGEGLSNYAHDKSLPNFTFLIERLIPTFLELEDMKVLPYRYTAETLPQKYYPYIDEIAALSDLKVLINKYDSDELYNVWSFYRYQFLDRHQHSAMKLE